MLDLDNLCYFRDNSVTYFYRSFLSNLILFLQILSYPLSHLYPYLIRIRSLALQVLV